MTRQRSPRRRAAVQSGDPGRGAAVHREVLAGVVAEMRATANDDLERAVRSLTVELADLKATLAEVRLAFATDRTQALDLPKLPLRSSTLQ